jgi:hypothetical protein
MITIPAHTLCRDTRPGRILFGQGSFSKLGRELNLPGERTGRAPISDPITD